ncbi:hypothetical protein Moror_7478 [Moniliophthora roreri MCA 2997]|uniref:DUF1308 domain-containing protein n=1 Tax=Moniliophthora roreri (strain MCA 2997) TaxID=1381753 RepID=V2XSY1_MONRO|nr:hypothetical protein Moror_7478 [Moniliophthora roreri MCA 2997]
MSTGSHPELRQLRAHLQGIHDSISHFQPPAKRPPILDSALEVIQNPNEDTHWLQHENIPGLKKLRETVRVDLDILDKFLEDPESVHLPALSTNAPYLIAVWNEVLCAPQPVACVFKGKPISIEARKQRAAEANQQRTPEAKVDVVADHRRRWIRVNTIKNSRILAEFREIDSYLTESEDSDSEDEDYRPSLAQKEFDNSVLRMGRSLVAAAKANPLQLPSSRSSTDTFTEIIPHVTMRLTRLDPEGEPNDPRIAQTIKGLEDMGIDVELGERHPEEIPEVPRLNQPDPVQMVFEPTSKINLDLSALIALVSDLTHSTLPTSIEEANERFVPPQKYLDWKKKMTVTKARAKALGKSNAEVAAELELGEGANGGEPGELPFYAQQDLAKHSRALTNQVLQEMGKGLLQEMHDQLSLISTPPDQIQFWTTPEARDRCLRIVSKIGGPNEKRRVKALLFDPDPNSAEQDFDTLEQAKEAYWRDSRFGHKFIPFIPIRLHSGLDGDEKTPDTDTRLPFFHSLDKTCYDILESEGLNPHQTSFSMVNGRLNAPRIPTASKDVLARAVVTKTNPRLTAHTVQSMLWGARLGWTTLTANRTSVKAIVKEINLRQRVVVFGDGEVVDVRESVDAVDDTRDSVESLTTPTGISKAAIWIIDPRSLAEGMRSDSDSAPDIWRS